MSTVEERDTALPRPDPGIDDLARRRLATAREALIEAAGVDAGRVVVRDDGPDVTPSGDGRVELELLPRG